MRKIIYKDKTYIYFIQQNIRPVYYKAKNNNKRINNKFRVSKDKFYKDITKSKRLNNKTSNKK